MPFVAIPGCAKVEMLQHDAEVNTETANVMHVGIPATYDATLFTAIANEFVDFINDLFSAGVVIPSTCTFESVRVTGLNNDHDLQTTTVVSSTGGGAPAASGLCALLKLTTPDRARRGRGRVYLGPLQAAAVSGSTITPAARSAIESEFANLGTALAALSTPIPVVIASRKYAVINPVSSWQAENTVAYQRRRGAR